METYWRSMKHHLRLCPAASGPCARVALVNGVGVGACYVCGGVMSNNGPKTTGCITAVTAAALGGGAARYALWLVVVTNRASNVRLGIKNGHEGDVTAPSFVERLEARGELL